MCGIKAFYCVSVYLFSHLLLGWCPFFLSSLQKILLQWSKRVLMQRVIRVVQNSELKNWFNVKSQAGI